MIERRSENVRHHTRPCQEVRPEISRGGERLRSHSTQRRVSAVSPENELKVKYGSGNGEVFAEVAASHSVYVSQPDAVVRLIASAARAVGEARGSLLGV